MIVAYLCDGKREKCSGRPGCYFSGNPEGECKHTTDAGHAIHGALQSGEDPADYPDRFCPLGDDKFYEIDMRQGDNP